MRKIFTTRRRIIIVGLASAAVLGTGSAAFAYFTSTGSGTGNASVGSASTWTVTQTSTTGTIFPGSGSSTLTFSVKNNGTGAQAFNTVTPAIANDGSGNIEVGGNPVVGCLATWFPTPTIVSEPAANTSIAAGGNATVQLSVSMTDSGTNQDKCQGATPQVTLTVNAG